VESGRVVYFDASLKHIFCNFIRCPRFHSIVNRTIQGCAQLLNIDRKELEMKNTPENDPAWDLLGKVSKQEASPMFSRNVLRSIRLEEQETTVWWKRLLTPAPIVAALATAAACVALIISTQTTNLEVAPTVVKQSSAAESFAEISVVYNSNDDLDSVISPISLIATYDTDSFSDLDLFLDL